MASPEEGAFEFGEGAHDVGHRRVLAGEDQALFFELHAHALAGESLGERTQVIEVAGKPVYAVTVSPVAGEPQEPP